MLFGYVFDIKAIAYFVSFYIIYMELISVAENCKKLGIPLPEKLSKKLNNGKSDDNE